MYHSFVSPSCMLYAHSFVMCFVFCILNLSSYIIYASTKHKLAFLKATKSARDFTFLLNLLSKQTYQALLMVKRKFILCFGCQCNCIVYLHGCKGISHNCQAGSEAYCRTGSEVDIILQCRVEIWTTHCASHCLNQCLYTILCGLWGSSTHALSRPQLLLHSPCALELIYI